MPITHRRPRTARALRAAAAVVAAATTALVSGSRVREAGAETAAMTAPTPARVERLANATFDDLRGWKATGSSLLAARADGRSGAAARVTTTAAGTATLADAGDVAGVAAGAECQLSAWVEAAAGTPLRLRWREYAGQNVTTDELATATATGGWQRLQVDLTARGGTIDVSAYGLHLPAGASVSVDDASLACVDPGIAFYDGFTRPDGLITNEYATWNPTRADAVKSPDWEATSGSLFARGGQGWTGVPDGASPDAGSTTATGSAVFRLNSLRRDFGNVDVAMRLGADRFVTTDRTPAADWDGVHIWLRHQGERQLYAASVSRRDGQVVIKKKCAGGAVNGGTYSTLAVSPGWPVGLGASQDVAAGVRDNADGSVTLRLWRGGTLVLETVDRGAGCAPLSGVGAVGVRGDNAEFRIDDFTVWSR